MLVRVGTKSNVGDYGITQMVPSRRWADYSTPAETENNQAIDL